jgi:Spy/CpxP family protein refolding chaperone
MVKKFPFSRRIAAGAVALALAGGGGLAAYSAFAANPPAQPGMPPDMHHDWEQKRESHLVEELGLNPQQAQLAQAAMAKMRPSRDMMEHMKKMHEARLEALMDPNFDPRKAAAMEDEERAAHEAHMKDARTAWFALWDSLDAGQRVKARLMLIKMAERGPMEHMPHEGMHGDMHDGEGPGPQGPRPPM